MMKADSKKKKPSCKDCFFYYEANMKVSINSKEATMRGLPKCGYLPGGIELDLEAPICSEFSKNWLRGE